MKFNIKALAVACAILWSGVVLILSLVNLAFPAYAQQFLEILSSYYPGYHANHSVVQAVIVTLYAIPDGLFGGAVFGWLYNRLANVA